MRIAIGADHAGFPLKEQVRAALERRGHLVADYGTDSQQSTDYPDYAAVVAREVASGRADRGVLVCFTGVGMSMAANKVPGIRAALGVSVDEVRLVRQHNDANILTLGGKFTDAATAEALLDVFLETPGGEDRAVGGPRAAPRGLQRSRGADAALPRRSGPGGLGSRA
jgi:ribose 5-phosphate isomerase B